MRRRCRRLFTTTPDEERSRCAEGIVGSGVEERRPGGESCAAPRERLRISLLLACESSLDVFLRSSIIKCVLQRRVLASSLVALPTSAANPGGVLHIVRSRVSVRWVALKGISLFTLVTKPSVCIPMPAARRMATFAELLERLGLIDKYDSEFQQCGILFEVHKSSVLLLSVSCVRLSFWLTGEQICFVACNGAQPRTDSQKTKSK